MKILVNSYGESNVAPKIFLDAEREVNRVIDDLMASPWSAITFKVDSIPHRADSRNPISYSLTITNSGTRALRVPLPKVWNSSGIAVEWQGLRKDVPLAEMTNDHSQVLKVGSQALSSGSLSMSAGEFTDLAPGSFLQLSFVQTFPWPPGTHDLHLSFTMNLQGPVGKAIGRVEWVDKATPFKLEK